MATSSVFRWLDGRGWLVFAGEEDCSGSVRAQALGRMAAADAIVAYIWLGGDSAVGQRALDDMEELGAPSGYLVDVLSEDDETVVSKLSDAGMIVIESMADVEQLRSALLGAAIEGIQAAFSNGAVILVEGFSIITFGAWISLSSGNFKDGLEWIQSALLLPTDSGIADINAVRTLLADEPAAIAVGIGSGSALALGPGGELELWGTQHVTVALGSFYTS